MDETIATVADYRLRYPRDSDVTDGRVQAALDDALDMIRARVGSFVGVERATLVRLTCLAARRAIASQDSGLDGLGSLQRTAGPYSLMVRPSASAGGAYLLDSEWRDLGVGVARAGFMSMFGEARDE